MRGRLRTYWRMPGLPVAVDPFGAERRPLAADVRERKFELDGRSRHNLQVNNARPNRLFAPSARGLFFGRELKLREGGAAGPDQLLASRKKKEDVGTKQAQARNELMQMVLALGAIFEESGIKISSLQQFLGITEKDFLASKVSITSAVRELLTRGILDDVDWAVVHEFLQLIDPDNLGSLSAMIRVSGIPVRIKEVEVAKADDLTTLGATSPSLPQYIDPREGMAESVEVMSARLPDGRRLGGALFTAVHEWDHVFPSDRSRYRAVNKDAGLLELYSTIFFNRITAEAMAMLRELRLAEMFHIRTGEDIYSFDAQKGLKSSHEEITDLFKGVEVDHYVDIGRHFVRELYKYISEGTRYINYKFFSLYAAFLRRAGVEEFPRWDDYKALFGDVDGGGEFSLDPKKIKVWFENFVVSSIEGTGIAQGLAVKMLALTREERHSIKSFMDILAGKQEMLGFLRSGFDVFVGALGTLLGDRPPPVKVPSTLDYSITLPIIPKPAAAGWLRPAPSDADSANEIILAGKLAELLNLFDSASDAYVSNYFGHYIELAEGLDEKSAATIFSRLLALARDGRVGPFGQWELATALHRYGHETTARELAQRMIAGLKVDDVQNVLVRSFAPGMASELISLINKCRLLKGETGDYDVDAFSYLKDIVAKELSGDYEEPRSFVIADLKSSIEKGLLLWAEKLSEYKKELGLSADADITSDELTSRIRRQRTKGADPKGFKFSGDERDVPNGHVLVGRGSVFSMLSSLIKIPESYWDAVELLSRFPDSFQKLELFKMAVEYLPASATIEQRTSLAASYERVLLRLEPALLLRKYVEMGEKLGDMGVEARGSRFFGDAEEDNEALGDAFEGSFDRSHLYITSMGDIAHLFLSSGDTALMAKGEEMISALKGDGVWFEGRFNDVANENSMGGTYAYNQPAFWKADVILNELDLLPGGRAKWLGEIRDLLRVIPVSIEERRSYKKAVSGLLWSAVGEAARDGDMELVEGLIASRDEEQAKIAPKKRAVDIREEDIKLVKDAAVFGSGFFRTVAGGFKGLGEFIELLRNDRRGRFTSKEIFGALSYLKDPDDVQKMAKIAIDRYIEEASGENKSDAKLHVKALYELSIPDSVKDEIFVYLIDRLTPAGRIISPVKVSAALGMVVNVFAGIDGVFSDGRLPRARSILLERFARNISKIYFQPDDPLVKGAVKGLAWLFGKFSSAGMSSPSERAGLLASGRGEELLRAAKWLDAYRVPAAKEGRVVEGLLDAMVRAVREKDTVFLESLAEPARSRSDIEVIGTAKMEVDGSLVIRQVPRSRHLRPEDFKPSSLVRKAFELWEDAVSLGDDEVASALFDIWAPATSRLQLDGRRGFYYRALKRGDIPLAKKREIFRLLSGSKDCSEFAELAWKELLARGDTKREALLYDIFQPLPEGFDKGDLPVADEIVALLVDFDAASAGKLARRYKEFLENAEFRFDLRNPFDIWLFAEYGRLGPKDDHKPGSILGLNGKMTMEEELLELTSFKNKLWLAVELGRSDVGDTWLFKVSRVFDAAAYAQKDIREGLLNGSIKINGIFPSHVMWRSYEQNGRPRVERFVFQGRKGRSMDRVGKKFLSLVAKEFGGKCPEALSGFEAAVRMRQRAKELVKVSVLDVPEHIKERSPLVQFIASRLFISLPAGVQQTLLLALNEAERSEATNLFVAATRQFKFGQWLSFWPGVPLDERENLAHLQSRATPSDPDEVREQIRSSISDKAVAEHIIKNMETRPAGVGTIADVYFSTLPDGERVAVKVITESKEADFRIGLGYLKKLRRSLELFGDRFDEALEAIEVIDMFIPMVEVELDLRMEAIAASSAASQDPEGIVVPRYDMGLTSKKVAVMDVIEGERFDPSNARHMDVVARRLPSYMMELVKEGGVINIDPQPGNLLIDGDRLVILDWGQVVDLKMEMSVRVMKFIEACAERNVREIVAALERLGKRKKGFDRAGLSSAVAELLEEKQAGELSAIIMKIVTACRRNGLVIDTSMKKLVKGLASAEASITPVDKKPAGEDASQGAGPVTVRDAEMLWKKYSAAFGWRYARDRIEELLR